MARRNYNFDFTQVQILPTFTFLRVLLVALLAFLAFSSAAHASQATLAWDASTQPEVTGYKIYWGTSSGQYTGSVDVGNVTTYTVTGLNSGTTYYFVATCYTATGAESGYSNQVSTTTPVVNTTPVANNGSLSVSGKTPASGTLVATDADGNALTRSIVTGPTKGTLTIINAATGAFTYTANTNTTTTDSFTFRAYDGTAYSNTAAVTVTITTGNTPPVSNNGNLLVVQNSVASTLLSATDVDKDPLTYTIVTNGSRGTVTYLNPQTGAFIYKPAKDATGLDTFTFKANDGKADSNVATVSVTIGANPYTVYEDAEDRTISGWTIFDSKPRGASITNVFDEQKQSYVIQTKGYGTDNGYRLLKAYRTYWKNTTQFVAQWSLKYSEDFQIYINVNTTVGQRYLTYTPATSDRLGSSQYVYFGIGSGTIKGQWHTFTRDLQADLEKAQPGAIITQVNNMDIRGNVRIDDVMLLAQLPALDTDNDGIPDDLETNIYGTDPATGDTSLCGIDDGYKLDYLGSGWNQDADGDGIINLLDDDMDNDGTPDADEITGGTDPLVDAP